MRYKRILLINPSYTGARVKVVFSAGLGYIAEILKNSGFEYDVLDMSLGYTSKHLKKRIVSFRPDLIGISMMTYRYKETYALIRNIKKNYTEPHTAVGGPHVSLFREKVLQDCSQIDYGIVLEGEQTIVELCKGNRLESIKGLIFRKQDAIVYNGDRPFISNLNEIPFPKYEKFELDKSFNKQVNALPIVSSRGCPFECVYCPVKYSIGDVFRARNPQSITDELAYWYERGYRRFSFADDNFTLSKERVYSLCQLLENSNLKGLKLSCDNGIRADSVDRDLLEFMKKVGFYRIAIGVEAGNNKILRNLAKKEDIAIIKKAIKDACELGYEVNLFFLVGSPGETYQDLQDSFRIAADYPIGTAHFYNVVPFPNTPLFDWIKRNNRFLKRPDKYLNDNPVLDNKPLFETPEMSKKERKRALKHAFGITRKTMCKAWARRLPQIGIFGGFFAYIYTTRFMQDFVLRNRLMRMLIYKIAHVFIS